MMHRSRFLGATLPLLIATAGCEGRLPAAASTGTTTGTSTGAAPAAGPDAGTDAGVTQTPDGGQLRVLFIGDSFTYVNDLPGILAAIAQSSGVAPAIAVNEVVQGGATLQELWSDGIAQTVIADGGWSYVVLQDLSVEPIEDPQSFLVYGQRFGALIVDAGSQPALFVTWAEAPGSPVYQDPTAPGGILDPAEMQDELTIGYDQLSRELPSSVLACVGPAFAAAEAQHPEIALIQADYSHPTIQGSYLAACTFYVALTGNAVPIGSSVPAGVSAAEAAALRSVAAIGRNCADAGLRAIVQMRDLWGGDDSEYARSDGGTMAFDFGTAGIAIPANFYLTNLGGSPAGLGDGLTLAPPFVWTNGVYPGGTGMAVSPLGGVTPFCGDSLDPNQGCALAVSYLGTRTEVGEVSVGLTGAYTTQASRAIQGEETARALLSATTSADFFAVASSLWLYAEDGGSEPFTLLLVNRGGATASDIAAPPLEAPFGWGAGGGNAFPGGVGSIAFDGGTYPLCSGGSLEPGAWCAVLGRFSPTGAGPFPGEAQISYADEEGPVAPGVSVDLYGQLYSDAGTLGDGGFPPETE